MSCRDGSAGLDAGRWCFVRCPNLKLGRPGDASPLSCRGVRACATSASSTCRCSTSTRSCRYRAGNRPTCANPRPTRPPPLSLRARPASSHYLRTCNDLWAPALLVLHRTSHFCALGLASLYGLRAVYMIRSPSLRGYSAMATLLIDVACPSARTPRKCRPRECDRVPHIRGPVHDTARPAYQGNSSRRSTPSYCSAVH